MTKIATKERQKTNEKKGEALTMDITTNRSETAEKETRNFFKFAHTGGSDGFKEKIKKLAEIAETEKWTLDGFENHILYHYILDTFDRCYSQNKIIESTVEVAAIFNTGLLSKNGQDIYGFFIENNNQQAYDNAQKWYFVGFLKCTDRKIMDIFDKDAPLAKYYDNYNELFYDPSCEIITNVDHIIDDNWERVKGIIKQEISKTLMKILLTGALCDTRKRIERNMRLVVPQFYNEKIMYLLPLSIEFDENNIVTFALAVEKFNSKYRANTIFTLNMAYGKARLLMKPESNWLLNE